MPYLPTRNLPAIAWALGRWYRQSARDLPWRKTRDPYSIWVSEIMLQQTRVETVIPRYSRWLARFPTVRALAEAPLDSVLTEWAGLGYYARARNLHLAAREVTATYGGQLPDDAKTIRSLPGIGAYTAGAILSLAFARNEPVLDGNVARVLTRLAGIRGLVSAASVRRQLWHLAGAIVSNGNAAELNQALMELGATHCAPRTPTCAACPVVNFCYAKGHGTVENYPTPSVKKKVPRVHAAAVALLRRGKVLLVRRPPHGLWGGLYELPTTFLVNGETPTEAAARIVRQAVGLVPRGLRTLTCFEHILTHRRIRFHGFVAEAPWGRISRRGYDAHAWLSPQDASARGISRGTARLLAALD